ncbi:MAG: hypothetical protein IT288_04540 [Bdellovibrionales bacterium]|nr:hypothetical protein [Bdellovibrionales bacterium]
MRRNNPLFVDSTKFSGDGIRTLFELSGLVLYEGERVVARVTDKNGHEQIVPLHETERHIFVGSIYLKHQEEITYLFAVKSGEGVLFETALIQGRASYLIASEWKPLRPAVTHTTFKPKALNIEIEPLPEFEAQKKSLMNAVQAMESYFAEL